MTIRTLLAAMAVSAALISSPASAATYEVDASHSDIGFKVKHIFSFVRGSFGEYTGKLEIKDGKIENLKASAVIKTASIDTKNKKRDDICATLTSLMLKSILKSPSPPKKSLQAKMGPSP